MASITGLVKSRQKQLKDLRSLIIRTEAGFNLVRRECDRMIARKSSLPEAEDLARLITLMRNADKAFDDATSAVTTAANGWK